MSFRQMVKKIKHIILGTFKNIFKIYPKFSKNRYMICSRCSHRKRYKLLGFYCDECGCIIKSKITIKEEKCPHDKW